MAAKQHAISKRFAKLLKHNPDTDLLKEILEEAVRTHEARQGTLATYHPRFSDDTGAALSQAGCTPAAAESYPGRLTGTEILELWTNGISPAPISRRHPNNEAYFRGLIEGHITIQSREIARSQLSLRQIREYEHESHSTEPKLVELAASKQAQIVANIKKRWLDNNVGITDICVNASLDRILSTAHSRHDPDYLQGKLHGSRIVEMTNAQRPSEAQEIVTWALTQVLATEANAPTLLRQCSEISSSKYKILGYLGGGRTGSVFSVYHEQAGVRRALKIIPVSDANWGEARALGILEQNPHPHIVRMFDVDDRGVMLHGQPVHTIAMEFIADKTLEEVIVNMAKISKNTREMEAANIGLQLIDAVEHLLMCNIRHRDINPRNIAIVHSPQHTIYENKLVNISFTHRKFLWKATLSKAALASRYYLKLIDFGISSDIHATPKDNKRFGGSCDLDSIGQVLYYFCTSKNLYNIIGKSDEEVKEDIDEYRQRLREEEKIETIFPHIDRNIRDKNLRAVIKLCISADNYTNDNLTLTPQLRKLLLKSEESTRMKRSFKGRVKTVAGYYACTLALVLGIGGILSYRESSRKHTPKTCIEQTVELTKVLPPQQAEQAMIRARNACGNLSENEIRQFYERMIEIEYDKGDLEKVIEYQTKLIDIDPGSFANADVLMQRAKFYNMIGNKERALADYDSLLTMTKEYAKKAHKSIDESIATSRQKILEQKMKVLQQTH